MFKVGDYIEVVSTKEELGKPEGLSWEYYGQGRYKYLGKRARIKLIHCGRHYLCLDNCYYGWEEHQIRKVE